ncbi:MAG TPA: hypothetical protein VMW66_05855 [Elusimicrobiales bacterium]|nr:hypothetical protein [Elusimicrobiales bacterium]
MNTEKLKNKYKKQLLALWILTRLALGITLIVSDAHMYGNSKPDFKIILSGLKVPGFFIHIIWLALPWVKLYIGGFIVLGIFTKTSALMSAGFHALSIIVLLYIKFAEIRVYSTPCSVLAYSNCSSALTFNTFLILLSMGIYFFNSSQFTFDGWVKKKGN